MQIKARPKEPVTGLTGFVPGIPKPISTQSQGTSRGQDEIADLC